MACHHEGITPEISFLVNFTNIIFTIIFIIEAILKIIAFGRSYFANSWNKFDFFVVVSSIFDIMLENMDSSSLEWLSAGPVLARVMRVLRVTRVLRLAGKAEGL